jgi:hypothetical protein
VNCALPMLRGGRVALRPLRDGADGEWHSGLLMDLLAAELRR